MDKIRPNEESLLQIKLTHLQLIQGVISRMASDVQTLKAMAVSVSAAVVALAQASSRDTTWLVWISLVPILVFWGLTARSLHVERAYRNLYDLVRKDQSKDSLSMNWRECKKDVACPLALLFTPTILFPYAAMTLVLVVTAVFLGQVEDTHHNQPVTGNTNVKQE